MAKEKKIAVCRLHWSTFIGHGIVLFFCLLFFLAELTSGENGFAFFFLGLGIFCVLSAFVTYKTTYIAMTESKIIGHKGFIRSKTLSAPLHKIQDLELSNGLFGKIFGYHTIKVSTAGTNEKEFVFSHMANAQAFVEAVHNEI